MQKTEVELPRPYTDAIVDKDVFTWVELILTAVAQKRDAEPLVDLAMRAGVDLDVLQAVINLTLDSLYDHVVSAAGLMGLLIRPGIDNDELFSDADLAALKDLGIDAEASDKQPN